MLSLGHGGDKMLDSETRHALLYHGVLFLFETYIITPVLLVVEEVDSGWEDMEFFCFAERTGPEIPRLEAFDPLTVVQLFLATQSVLSLCSEVRCEKIDMDHENGLIRQYC